MTETIFNFKHVRIPTKEFTRVECRIIRCLEDGERHHKTELKELLYDVDTLDNNLTSHMSNVRKKLEIYGVLLSSVYHFRKFYYQMSIKIPKQ